jgi:very-short-patch-repair endonuclease
MDIRAAIRRYGGLAATWQLAEAGVGRHAIRQAIEGHDVVRVRQGWYAEAGRRDVIERAARVGGRVTCVTALGLRGFWVHGDSDLHVAVGPDRTQLRASRDPRRRLADDPSRVRVHWSESPDGDAFVTGPVGALRHYAGCATPEFFAASAESVIHRAPDLAPQVRALSVELPRLHRLSLAAVDGTCQSGIETLFRWRTRDLLTVPLRTQVALPNVGDVDFVLGDRLVVEVDGREYHEKQGQFEKDRERDASLSSQGFRVLRYSYRQVIWAWPTVERAVLAAIARGDAW